VELLTPECGSVHGDWMNDNAIVVGIGLPLSDDIQQISSWGAAMECAIGSEMNAFAEALPYGIANPAEGGDRPLVAVVCDDTTHPDAVYRHLVDDVGTKLVSPATAIADVVPEIIAPADVLSLAILGGAGDAGPQDDSDLFWRIPSATAGPSPAVHVVTWLEPIVRGKNGDQDIKVTFLVDGSVTSQGAANEVLDADLLVFNGMPWSANLDNFQRIDLCDTSKDPECDLCSQVPEFNAFAPDVVITHLSSVDWVSDCMAQVDGADTDGSIHWIHGTADTDVLAYLASGSASPGLAERSFSLSEELSALYGSFQANFAAECSEHTPPNVPGYPPLVENAHDFVYLAHYAFLAGGNAVVSSANISGQHLALGLGALSPEGHAGPAQPGPFDRAHIATTHNLLVSGVDVDVEGASGALDFGLDTRYPSKDYQLSCIVEDPSQPGTYLYVPAGVEYHAGTGEFEGEFTSCPVPR
jgi:hypothetical protein